MITFRKITLETNVGPISIRMKLFEDHSIQYYIFLGQQAGMMWKNGIKDDKAKTCKLIIDELDGEDVVKMTDPLWKTKILDAFITAPYPAYVKKNCVNCRFCVCVGGDENNLCCERFDESLSGCNVEDECGCDFFEENEWCSFIS